MNNCIGLKNQKAFLLFNLYTALSGGYSVMRAFLEIVHCFSDDASCMTYTDGARKGSGLAIAAYCGFFVLFTAVMFFDQIKMKYDETSTIDKM